MSDSEKHVENEQELTPPAEETAAEKTEVNAAPEEENASAAPDENTERLTALTAELEETKKQQLYLMAEYDNFRKRTARERETTYRDAVASTAEAFLPVYDNLERAVAGLAEDDPHRQGMELIFKQYKECLEKCGVAEIDALGKPFDPERMNAVMHGEDESLGENTVAEVFQKGFTIGEKVLRFAMVRVVN